MTEVIAPTLVASASLVLGRITLLEVLGRPSLA